MLYYHPCKKKKSNKCNNRHCLGCHWPLAGVAGFFGLVGSALGRERSGQGDWKDLSSFARQPPPAKLPLPASSHTILLGVSGWYHLQHSHKHSPKVTKELASKIHQHSVNRLTFPYQTHIIVPTANKSDIQAKPAPLLIPINSFISLSSYFYLLWFLLWIVTAKYKTQHNNWQDLTFLRFPGFVRLSQPLVSCFWLRLLIHTHPETYQQLFSGSPWCFLFALLQNKRSLSLYTFLFYIHQFLVSSSFCFFCLARCSFRLFPNFRWDALWGIYSDVSLP